MVARILKAKYKERGGFVRIVVVTVFASEVDFISLFKGWSLYPSLVGVAG